jgi:hypothetical protein
VRYPDSDVSRVGPQISGCKTGGRDRRSREFGARKLKVQILEGSSREARDSESATGEYRSLVTSGLGRWRNQQLKVASSEGARWRSRERTIRLYRRSALRVSEGGNPSVWCRE